MLTFFVSILVLMDAALRQGVGVNDTSRIQVSILVLMDAALRLYNKCFYQNKTQKVSILVLMDAALRRRCLTRMSKQWKSFNPCFDGCRPAT